ncbi:hypothetical protein ANO11243_097060 [Dothideomycetidae sp. 11243]|nr:hypothetical protein ANO11243_097060 [fungal sp. No.11243]
MESPPEAVVLLPVLRAFLSLPVLSEGPAAAPALLATASVPSVRFGVLGFFFRPVFWASGAAGVATEALPGTTWSMSMKPSSCTAGSCGPPVPSCTFDDGSDESWEGPGVTTAASGQRGCITASSRILCSLSFSERLFSQRFDHAGCGSLQSTQLAISAGHSLWECPSPPQCPHRGLLEHWVPM